MTDRTCEDGDSGLLCVSCETEDYEEDYEECVVCGAEYPPDQFYQVIAVFDPASAGLRGKPPGLYRILEGPFYMSNYLNAWLIESAVEYAAPLPAGASGDGYPCGLVCDGCSKAEPRCASGRTRLGARGLDRAAKGQRRQGKDDND